ncbi:Fungalysin metallopeptidase-domain-containing protein [Infundibulicybe gibba]|nr:Fungalysin metallopeptidase-domain-containing protein [Infundibulicybe gibba]
MPPSDKFLGPILLAITCQLVSGGAYQNSVSSESPISSSKYATGNPSHLMSHRSRDLTHVFQPPTIFLTLTNQKPFLAPGPTTIEAATAMIMDFASKLVYGADVQLESEVLEKPRQFRYLKQRHEDVPFVNAVANYAYYKGRLVAFGSSFVRINPLNIAPPVPSRKVESVIPRAEKILNGKFNGHAPTLEYIVERNGRISLAHVVQIQNGDKGTWFEAFMDAHSGKFIAVNDFVARASYKVVPIWEGGFGGRQVTLKNPHDPFLSESPMGWHNNGTTTTTTTEFWQQRYCFQKELSFRTRQKEIVTTPETRPGLVFDYTLRPDTLDPKIGKNNLDAARTNAFYVINMMHDIAYKYGFTENLFNFQTNNFGKGGFGNDRIEVQVHDDSDEGSSSFHTPPEGQSGICQLRVWGKTLPRRDVAMDNSMIIHQFTHGMTRRMVGGGSARCLRAGESAGLGEGFSDIMAEWVQEKPIPPGSSLPDYVIGRYFTGRAAGLRTYPYSTSETINPLRYSAAGLFIHDVHKVGEVWANMLHNVYAALVDGRGFSKNAKTDATTSKGNVVFMHLFVDALSLLPCNPTYAWIEADQLRYGGVNRCLLWNAFASRGLGIKAAKFIDDSSVPGDCIGKANTSKNKSWFYPP